MSKRHHPAPIPPGNRPRSGTSGTPESDANPSANAPGTGFGEEDPKRRLGDYTGTAEHSRQQPGPLNDGGRPHGEDAS